MSYTPIDCNFYDRLEAAAVRARPVVLRLATSDGPRDIRVRIVDLYSRDKVEYAAVVEQPIEKEATPAEPRAQAGSHDTQAATIRKEIRLDAIMALDGNVRPQGDDNCAV